MDRWHGLTMEDIRAIEDKTNEELDKVSILYFLFFIYPKCFFCHKWRKKEMHTAVWLEHSLGVDVEVLLTFIAQK
jgi:hypothetical protein